MFTSVLQSIHDQISLEISREQQNCFENIDTYILGYYSFWSSFVHK